MGRISGPIDSSGEHGRSRSAKEQQAAGGITPELVRLSVGIEHFDDILGDIVQSLGAAPS